MKLSDLVFDYTVNPRMGIDSAHVADLVEAIRKGAKLPPIVADKETKRVADGFHRGRAYQRIFEDKPDAEIEVDLRPFKNDAELYLAAAQLNATHGKRLSRFERARVALRLKQYGVGLGKIADALGVRVTTLRAIGEGRVARDMNTGEEVTLKPSARHLAGKELTAAQVDAQPRLAGPSAEFHAAQLLIHIESGVLDRSNESLMKQLARLHAELGKVLDLVASA